jgi:tetratricopeptide (TPR) repeat protein
MPQSPARSEATPSRGFPLRGLLGLVATAALLFYIFTPAPGSWRLALAQREAGRNPQRALQHLDEVLRRNPDHADAHELRVRLLMQQKDDTRALAAIRDALNVPNLSADAKQKLLMHRIEILQRLGRHQAALNDADQWIALGPVDPASTGITESSLHNGRAYYIARAAADKQATPRQLATAMQDMQQAFAGLARLRQQAAREDANLSLGYWEREAQYLDTLGYLELAAGNLPAALRNLNRAIQLCDHIDQMLTRTTGVSAMELEGQRQSLRLMRAVLMHHRGEVLLALGNTAEGQRDIKLARLQGYSREEGNW